MPYTPERDQSKGICSIRQCVRGTEALILGQDIAVDYSSTFTAVCFLARHQHELTGVDTANHPRKAGASKVASCSSVSIPRSVHGLAACCKSQCWTQNS